MISFSHVLTGKHGSLYPIYGKLYSTITYIPIIQHIIHTGRNEKNSRYFCKKKRNDYIFLQFHHF